jgi:hypothetical protein
MVLRRSIPIVSAAICASLVSCGSSATSPEGEALATQENALTSYAPYFYLECNATSWETTPLSRMQPTSDPNVFTLGYKITQTWMTAPGGQDQCHVVNTVGLDTTSQGATWYGRQGGWATVNVPGSVGLAAGAGDFGVAYPSLGEYEAKLDLSKSPPVLSFAARTSTSAADLAGSVLDASSKSGVAAVDIFATGQCAGTGCASASQGHELSASSGQWVFDANGNLNGANDVQAMTLAGNVEAFTLLYQKAGYQPVTQYYRPVYKQTTINNISVLAATAPAVYLCASAAPDSDGDGLCDAAEAAYGTSPNNADTDGDAISDLHEVLGAEGLDLSYYGASPTHRDIFVYMNYYVAPFPGALTQAMEAFSASPVTNPDGTTGIKLHIIDGGPIAAADQISDLQDVWTQVDAFKAKYYPSRWAKYSHYMLIGYQYNGGTSSGLARGIPAHDFIVTLGTWFPSYGTQLQQAGTILHELGHDLGLSHGGDEGTNNKPNYLSVMSYRYQVVGLYRDGKDGVIDYSRLQLAAVNESSLLEQAGMPPTGSTTTTETARYRATFCAGLANGTVKGPIDFNGDGAFATRSIAADLDCDGFIGTTFQPSWNDWTNLIYTGSEFGGGLIGPGAHSLTVTPQIISPDKMEKELDHP